jgi:hypothetical protein
MSAAATAAAAWQGHAPMHVCVSVRVYVRVVSERRKWHGSYSFKLKPVSI